MTIFRVGLTLLLSLASIPAFSQEIPKPTGVQTAETQTLRDTEYKLGPNDQVHIWALDVGELSDKTFTLDTSGSLNLPMLGRVQAEGSTVNQLESEIKTRLKTYVRDPQVVLNVAKARAVPVSVLGAVGKPGVLELDGKKTLLDIISAAGGFAQDSGHVVQLTRQMSYGKIPVADSIEDPKTGLSTAEIPVMGILASNPEANVEVMPNDVIQVPKAQLVYVTGEVRQQAGIVLDARGSISVLQALAKVGGLNGTAAPQNAKILRPILNGVKQAELPIDVRRMIAGKANDVQLLPNDILVIPADGGKKTAAQAIGVAGRAAVSFASFGLINILR